MRVIFRAVLVLAVVALGAYLLGFWSPNDFLARWRAGTPTTVTVDTKAVQVQKVDAFVTEAGLSGKIKSKMALDDVVRARTIDVSTVDGVVTLTGTVQSIAERDQALRLARDTKGVTRVVDHLIVRP
jgi:hyperosmotically inducible protein